MPADPAAAEHGTGDVNVKGAFEAAAEWIADTFDADAEFGRLEMIAAFSEGAKCAERQKTRT